MITLRGLSRTYMVGGQPVYALRDVTFTIEPGEYLSIMGTSGSGKSTLLNLLGCLDRPTGGTYHFEGREVGTLSELDLARIRQHRIGFVFQFFHLVPRLTAAGNVELPMIFAGLDPKERRERVRAALSAVGLEGRTTHRPEQLSGGERQRVAIARAIGMRPSILLADEPTGNLDSKTGREIVELLEAMNRDGLTVVVVTHDASLGARARRRIRLADGELVEDARTPAAP